MKFTLCQRTYSSENLCETIIKFREIISVSWISKNEIKIKKNINTILWVEIFQMAKY